MTRKAALPHSMAILVAIRGLQIGCLGQLMAGMMQALLAVTRWRLLPSKSISVTSSVSTETIGSALQARQDFNQVKDIAGQAGRKFSNLAQNFIKDLQGGY